MSSFRVDFIEQAMLFTCAESSLRDEVKLGYCVHVVLMQAVCSELAFRLSRRFCCEGYPEENRDPGVTCDVCVVCGRGQTLGP